MGCKQVKKIFALRAQSKGTIESFLSKKGYNKVKISFALRAQRRGTTESFLSKKGWDKINFIALSTTKIHCAARSKRRLTTTKNVLNCS